MALTPRSALLIALTCAVLGLTACVPAPLGSTDANPYSMEDFPTFTSPAGQPLFARARYNQQVWRATRPLGTGVFFSFNVSIELGGPGPAAPDVRSVFGDPFQACGSAGQTVRRPAQGLGLSAEVPAGWSLGLAQAVYVLECGQLRDEPGPAGGIRALTFRTWLELVYRVGIPAATPAGTYTTRWQVTEGSRALITEDRRFVVTGAQ